MAPTVTEATCAAGVVTAPTIELATEPAGVTYAADPAGPYDPTVDTDVVVTATVLDGFAWEDGAGPSGFARQSAAPSQVELPDGWTLVSPTEATSAVALAAIPRARERVAPTSSVAIEAAESTTTTPGAAAAPTSTTPGAAGAAESPRRPVDDAHRGSAILAETEAASEVAAAAVDDRRRPTSVAAAATATTVAEAIPATGATGLPLQLIIALLSVAGGVLLVIGARRRIH